MLEPVSNEAVALNYRLITLPKGSLKIATLSLKPTVATTDFSNSVVLTVETVNGVDSQGWSAVSRDTDIAKLENSRVTPTNNVGTFTILTGTNAGSKSGTVYIDLTGINTGSRATFQLTISASGT